jgi:hypothetical protein
VTRRNTILLVLVAFAAVSGAYWMLVLSPKRQEAATLDGQIVAKQTALGQAQAELASYEAARSTYRANYTKVARLGKAVPADDDVRSLMVQLNSAASTSKVDFRTISIGGSSAPPPGGVAAAPKAGALTPPPGSSIVGTAGFSTMPFSFKFKGSFFSLSEFFSRLDNFVKVRNESLDVTGRLLLLNSISLAPDPTKGYPLIAADVSANSYLLPPAQGLLAGATAAGPTAASAATPATGAPSTAPATTTTATVGVTR